MKKIKYGQGISKAAAW